MNNGVTDHLRGSWAGPGHRPKGIEVGLAVHKKLQAEQPASQVAEVTGFPLHLVSGAVTRQGPARLGIKILQWLPVIIGHAHSQLAVGKVGVDEQLATRPAQQTGHDVAASGGTVQGNQSLFAHPEQADS